jgi:regulator of sigma E protease
VGDPFTLAQRLLPSVGEEVEFVVERRGADEPATLRATLAPPATYVDNFGPGSPVALECLGIAFDVGNVVRAVEYGSPADMQGLQAGDKVEMVQFLLGEWEAEDPIPLVGPGPDGSECDLPNWAHVHTVMNMLTDSTLQLTYRRGGMIDTVVLTPQRSDRWFHPSRKLNTTSLTLVRISDSWLEAGGLGVRDSLLILRQTLAVLQRIVTGRMSRSSLGGPVMIARSAGSEASYGLARFFLFLAFLSVNLALFNCLPIPPLDGGHIVLLAIEGIRKRPVSRNAQVVVISLSLAIVFILLRSLLVPCLSQLIRSIGLIRRKAPRKSPAQT